MPSRQNREVFIDESPDSVARRTFVVLLVATGFLLLLGFLFLIREIIVWLVIALIFTLALAPLVSWLVRHSWNRVLASLVAVLVTILIIVGVVTAIATPLVTEGSKLADNLPSYVENATKSETLQSLDAKYHFVQRVRDSANKLPEVVSGAGTPVLKTAQSTVNAIATLGIILTLTFFLLMEGPQSWKQFLALLRPRHATRVERTGHKIAKAVSGYVSGNLFISLIAGVVALVTLLILDVPYAVPLAVLVALFDLIPLIGAAIAAAIVALVALSVSPLTALIALIVILVYQQVEGNVIQPLVYSRTVKLSPLLILIASIIGATLGGIIGVLLAIPLAAAAQIMVVEVLSGTAAGSRAKISEA